MPRMESWRRWRWAGAGRVPARKYTAHPGVFVWSFMSLVSIFAVVKNKLRLSYAKLSISWS